MISSPYPLPALLPWVDLRAASSVFGRTITTKKKFTSLFHAAGSRYYSSALFFGGRFRSDSQGNVYYERDASFTLALSTSGVLGSTFAATTATAYGPVYRVYFTSPNWTTQAGSTTSYSFTLNGTGYSVDAASLENFFAFTTYSERAASGGSLLNSTSYGPSFYTPWNWTPSSSIRTYSGSTTDALKQMAAYRQANTTYDYVKPIGFFPSRPLQATPELIAEERVDQLVSISGKSYRKSYARRRIYEAKLLIDASLTDASGMTYYNASVLWPQFLAACDSGISLYIDRQWFSQFWRPRYSVVCPDMPNLISGQLLDASAPRLQVRDGVQYAFEVTLQIADESGIDGAAFGGRI